MRSIVFQTVAWASKFKKLIEQNYEINYQRFEIAMSLVLGAFETPWSYPNSKNTTLKS